MRGKKGDILSGLNVKVSMQYIIFSLTLQACHLKVLPSMKMVVSLYEFCSRVKYLVTIHPNQVMGSVIDNFKSWVNTGAETSTKSTTSTTSTTSTNQLMGRDDDEREARQRR